MVKFYVINRVRYYVVTRNWVNLQDEESKAETLYTVIAVSKGKLYRLTRREKFGGWLFGQPFNHFSDWVIEELCQITDIMGAVNKIK